MGRFFIPLLVFILLGFPSQSQVHTQTVRGTIIDGQTKTPLIGANVMIMGLEPVKAATTDEKGSFRIAEVPIGRHSIRITYMGYKETGLSNIVVSTGKEVILNIEMEEAIISGQEVTIKANRRGNAKNEMATISSRSFSIDETNRYAGSLNDPSRMAQNFAGVAGSNDQRNDIIIRGNSPVGLLWRLEGVDIPSPNHFSAQGANGGPISILNNNTLANSDFMTGAFPAEYGNANSGAFDLRMRNGNNERFEFIGQIGFNGLEMLAEGPISKKNKSSFLLGYRYSTLGLFDAIGMEFGAAGIPKYQDLAFKLNFPGTKAGSFSIFGIGGMSSIQLLDSEKEKDDNSYGVDDKMNVDFGSKMGVGGISHTIPLSKKSYLKTTLATSAESIFTAVDSLSASNAAFRIYDDNSKQFRNVGHTMYNHKFNAQHSLRVGFIGTRYSLDLFDQYYDQDNNEYRRLRKFNGSTGLLQAYSQWKYNITSRLTFNLGAHYLHFLLNDKKAIEPRAGVKYSITNSQAISFGYGTHNQMQQLPVYFYESRLPDGSYVSYNRHLDFTRSQHYVLGYDNNLTSNFRARIETYYQYIDQVPVEAMRRTSFSMLNFGTDFSGVPAVDSLQNFGTGENYGIELTLERFFNNNYYFLFTTSLFESKYRGSDGIKRNTAFNGNYVINLLGGYEKPLGVNKNKLIIFDAKVTVAGGKRYSPIDLPATLLNEEIRYDETKAFSEQFNQYFRADLKLTYRINKKRFSHEWGITAQNAFDTQNILTRSYDKKNQSVRDEYQLGRLIIPHYKILF